MDVIIGPLITVIQMALNLYVWLIIVQAVMSWLIAFGIINTRNRFVYLVGDFLYRITEPLLRPRITSYNVCYTKLLRAPSG